MGEQEKFRGGYARAVHRLFGDEADTILQQMTAQLSTPTHEFGLFLLALFDFETHEACFKGTFQIDDMDVVAEVTRAWVETGCHPLVAGTFRGQGRNPEVVEAIRAIPELSSYGLTAANLSQAWREDFYIPLLKSLRRGTPLEYALIVLEKTFDS